MNERKGNAWKTISGILAVLLLISVFTNGFGGSNNAKIEGKTDTFSLADFELCTEDGKPVVRLFSTTWCPHCQWISETFDKVAGEFEGDIVAYHWELDTKDNTLTDNIETSIPSDELDIYMQFNPLGSVPTFVFGCQYARIGNGYETDGDIGLIKEEIEFRKIIEKLVTN